MVRIGERRAGVLEALARGINYVFQSERDRARSPRTSLWGLACLHRRPENQTTVDANLKARLARSEVSIDELQELMVRLSLQTSSDHRPKPVLVTVLQHMLRDFIKDHYDVLPLARLASFPEELDQPIADLILSRGPQALAQKLQQHAFSSRLGMVWVRSPQGTHFRPVENTIYTGFQNEEALKIIGLILDRQPPAGQDSFYFLTQACSFFRDGLQKVHVDCSESEFPKTDDTQIPQAMLVDNLRAAISRKLQQAG